MSFITNAIIESADIRIERGFILSAWLQLNYGGLHQGFGGYTLHLTESSSHHAESLKANVAGVFITKCMEIADVESWKDLPGKTIRVEKTDEWGSIIRIGHIVKDRWFNPQEVFEEMKKQGE